MGPIMPRPALLLFGILVRLAAGAEEDPFDLFLLVRTYSPGFCKTTKCTVPPVSAFTVHSLWPFYENGGFPQHCKTVNATGPQPDSAEMRCKWKSFKGRDADFWEHEWDKSGTCAEPVLGDRPNFFRTALELDEVYDLAGALAAYNVTPSDTHSYAAKDLLNAVSDSYGAAPLLRCKDKSLVEIRMCLSLDLKPIPCPPAFKSECGATLNLLEGNPVEAACSKFFPPPGQAGKWANLVRGAGTGAVVAAA
ncbi:hypothetical protein N2152v2_001848 [Parachlorella kessleri]